MKPTALLVTTTNWVPTARLAMAIRNAGFRVEAVCPTQHPMGKTHAVSRAYRYRGWSPLASLASAIASAKPDLVIPGDDLAARHLHDLYRRDVRIENSNDPPKSRTRGASELSSLITRSLGLAEAFPVIHERAAFLKVAREEGIRVPDNGVIENDSDLSQWVERAGLPTVLKADGTSGGEGVCVVRTADEARRAFRKLRAAPLLARAVKRTVFDQDSTLLWPALSRRRPLVSAQVFVAGREATSTVACWQGTVLASLHFEVLRKSSDAGHATVVRLLENAEMSSAVEKIVRRMGLSGLCGFDFMMEATTGNAYLIEINPRATQVGHLTLGAGRDLPAALYGAVTGHPSKDAPAVTNSDTITLFPHEWARDPQSEFLRSGYHDVPWDTPELVHACIERSRKQSAWYARREAKRWADSAYPAAVPVVTAPDSLAAKTETWGAGIEPSAKRTTHAANRS